jgi:hypothetical protein
MMETQEETEIQGEVVPHETIPEISAEIVQRAKGMGHIPKEEFRGDPEKWVDAEKYVERAENLMPILKSQLGKYEGEISTLKATVASQTKTTEQILKMNEKTQKLAYDMAVKDVTEKQAKFVEDGNVDEWRRLEGEKEQIAKPEPVKIEEPEQNPAFNQWHTGNEWYLKDEGMTDYANLHAQRITKANPSMPYDEVLTEVEKKIKDTFPQKFENPNREKPSVVDSGATREIAPKQGNTYNDLPADAKAICKQNVDQGLYKSKEDWVKSYFEEA